METLVTKLVSSSMFLQSYFEKNIPIRLGLIVKSNYEQDGVEDIPTIDTDTGWAVKGWYIENDSETYVHCIALHSGPEIEETCIFPDYSTGEVDISYLSESQIEWIRSNGSCYFGQSVRLNSTSRHYQEYGDSDFAILSVEGNQLNEFLDSSKAECNWLWDSEINWVIIGLNANSPLTDEQASEIQFTYGLGLEENSVLSTIADYTTLLAVQYSEIDAIQ